MFSIAKEVRKLPISAANYWSCYARISHLCPLLSYFAVSKSPFSRVFFISIEIIVHLALQSRASIPYLWPTLLDTNRTAALSMAQPLGWVGWSLGRFISYLSFCLSNRSCLVLICNMRIVPPFDIPPGVLSSRLAARVSSRK